MPVVMPMLGCPPQDAFLRRHRPDQAQKELKEARRFECPMREIAVIRACYSKHTKQIQNDKKTNCILARWHEKSSRQARNMDS
jgi:hypothetical protein